ncbi:hypothetical protein [Streptomyces sp. NBC_00400]|uniref:hypothetical protein n=1 Tax=Streptomyces sp. NBC_00400 TaxID=2975737 RepID=UPI002E1CD413
MAAGPASAAEPFAAAGTDGIGIVTATTEINDALAAADRILAQSASPALSRP